MKTLATLILSLIAAAAFATGYHPEPPKTPSSSTSATSTSHGGNATATGGNAHSTSGASSTSNVKTNNTNTQGQKQHQGQSQSANNEGNSLSVVNEQVRQAPAVAQGGLVMTTCGFGGNAGGSRSSGSAFLGLEIKTAGCWDAEQIANEAALGHYKTACELNRLTPAGKRNMERLKAAGLTPEPCAASVIVTETVTKEYVNEAVSRAFTKSQGK